LDLANGSFLYMDGAGAVVIAPIKAKRQVHGRILDVA